MVHWWVQVHFGYIFPHTCFSVFFFIFWMLKFWQNFIENFTNLAKIALEKKNPQISPISFSKYGKTLLKNKFDNFFKSKLGNHVIIRN
jgi:hypothetical protein